MHSDRGRLVVPDALDYWIGEQLDRNAQMAAVEPKIHTVEELDTVLRSKHQWLRLWLVEGWRRKRGGDCKVERISLLYACPLRIVNTGLAC